MTDKFSIELNDYFLFKLDSSSISFDVDSASEYFSACAKDAHAADKSPKFDLGESKSNRRK